MTTKEAYEKWGDMTSITSYYAGRSDKTIVDEILHDLWSAIKHEATPPDVERVRVRLRELAEWFDSPGQSPAIAIHHMSAGYLLREVAAGLEYTMAEQRNRLTNDV